MNQKIRIIDEIDIFKEFKIDCKKCFGLCCVSLYFSKVEGFPQDKVAGKPCINLTSDFSCSVHKSLVKKGLKGCTSYDCFGAGQKVAQVTYKGEDWTKNPHISSEMFDVFVKMRQLHEMLYYLIDASTFVSNKDLREELSYTIKETRELTNLEKDYIVSIDIDKHRLKVNDKLRKVNELVKDKVSYEKLKVSTHKKNMKDGYDFIGSNLTKANLIGANFAGALLIAANLNGTNLKGANFIGADLRDADIRGANLEDSIFITQSQVNTAKGNTKTKLPKSLVKPSNWNK